MGGNWPRPNWGENVLGKKAYFFWSSNHFCVDLDVRSQPSCNFLAEVAKKFSGPLDPPPHSLPVEVFS